MVNALAKLTLVDAPLAVEVKEVAPQVLEKIKKPILYHKIGFIIDAIKEKYKAYEQITLDGIRIEAPDYWFCVRKSNTEPLLKVALEAKDRVMYNAIIEELRGFFTSYGAVEKV